MLSLILLLTAEPTGVGRSSLVFLGMLSIFHYTYLFEYVEMSGQLLGVSSFHPPCGSYRPSGLVPGTFAHEASCRHGILFVCLLFFLIHTLDKCLPSFEQCSFNPLAIFNCLFVSLQWSYLSSPCILDVNSFLHVQFANICCQSVGYALLHWLPPLLCRTF